MADVTNRLLLKVGLTFSQTEELKNFNKEFTAFKSKIQDLDLAKTMGFKNVSKDVDGANKGIQKTGGLITELGTKFKAQLKNFAIFSVMSGSILFLTTQMRNAVSVVSELDKSYTNFAIVTGATAEQIAEMDAQANKLTETLGRLKKEVIDSITEFSRAGYALDESITLAKNSIIGANVGFTDLANVTKFVIAGLKSFKLEAEDSAKLIDVLFQVSNKTAIDFEGIGEAFLRSANTLQVAGASLEETTALISAANESIQDASKVGTALKTIAARLRGVGDEGEAIPSLARDFKAVGIELQNADGSFRNIYDIFRDFAAVYKDLDDLTKQSLVEKIAGKRQANIFIGLIENWDVAEMALTEGLNSVGSAAVANEKFLESIEGRVNTLKNAINDLYQSLTSSQGIKILISVFTGLVKIVTTLTNGVLGLASGIGLLYASIKVLVPLLSTLTFGWAGVGGAVLALAGFLITASGAFDVFKDSTESLNQKLAETTSNIASLDSKIKDLKAIKDRTDAENQLLSVLEKRLEVEKKIKDINTQDVSADLLNDTSKSIEAINYKLQQYEALDLETVLISSADSFADASDKLKEYELDLLSSQESALELLSTTEQGTKANGDAQKTYDLLTDALNRVKNLQYAWGIEIRDTTDATSGQISTQQQLANLYGKVRSNLVDATSNYQLLTDAIDQMTTTNKLEEATLESLKTAYPELIPVLGDNKEAFVDYAKTLRNESRSTTGSLLADLIAQQKIYQTQIEDFAKVQEYISKDPILGNMAGADQVGARLNDTAVKNLKDINALIGEVNNALDTYDSILETSNDTKTKSNSTSTKTVEILTEEEKTVRDLSQAIALKERELKRAEGEEQQIAINKELIELNKQLKTALIAQKDAFMDANKSLKDGTPEYDDYIEKLYKLSLQIEDTTNVIFDLEKANYDLAKSILEANQELAKSKFEESQNKLLESIDAEIDKLEKAKKASQDYYDTLIDNKQAEIDAFNETNELIDEQIKLQEALDNLEELREQRRNILANRNVRLVQNADVGFEWVSDPRELRSINEQIIQAEKDVDKTREEIRRNSRLRELEAEKKYFEDMSKLESDNLDKSINAWDTYKENVSDGLAIFYSEQLSAVEQFVIDYNNALSQLNSASTSLDSFNGTLPSTPSGNSKNFNFDAIYTDPNLMSKVPTSNDMANKVTTTTNTKSNSTNIGNINISSGAKTIDQLLDDINTKAKTYQPKIQIY